MKLIRWSVAGLVAVAVCAAVTWTSGAFILPQIMTDLAARWAVASALGLAAAALAALWGQSFATNDVVSEGSQGATSMSAATGSGRTHNKISGGRFHGTVIQGRDFSGPVSGSSLPSPDSGSGSGSGSEAQN